MTDPTRAGVRTWHKVLKLGSRSRAEYLAMCRDHVLLCQKELRHLQVQYLRSEPHYVQLRDYGAATRYVEQLKRSAKPTGRIEGEDDGVTWADFIPMPTKPKGYPIGAVAVYRQDDGTLMCGASQVHPDDLDAMEVGGIRPDKWECASRAIRNATPFKELPDRQGAIWLGDTNCPYKALEVARELIERAVRRQRLFDEKQAVAQESE